MQPRIQVDLRINRSQAVDALRSLEKYRNEERRKRKETDCCAMERQVKERPIQPWKAGEGGEAYAAWKAGEEAGKRARKARIAKKWRVVNNNDKNRKTFASFYIPNYWPSLGQSGWDGMGSVHAVARAVGRSGSTGIRACGGIESGFVLLCADRSFRFIFIRLLHTEAIIV